MRKLKQRRFWATHVNWKWGLFHFKAPWRYQIRISKWLYYFTDDLSKILGKNTVHKWKKTTSGWRTSLKNANEWLIEPCEQSHLLSSPWSRRRKGGSAWITSRLWSRRTQASGLVKLVFDLFFECEHPFIDKPMVKTEPAVPSRRLLRSMAGWAHCWFARDVTAAMLMVKNRSISLLWEPNSIFMYILQEKIYSIDSQHGRLVRWLQPLTFQEKTRWNSEFFRTSYTIVIK